MGIRGLVLVDWLVGHDTQRSQCDETCAARMIHMLLECDIMIHMLLEKF